MRTTLYMAALVGVRWNPALKVFALVACMRKLLAMLNRHTPDQ
ncbi:hypothetical protein BH11GEM1_BH11GEM1_32440 [soil metagenome]